MTNVTFGMIEMGVGFVDILDAFRSEPTPSKSELGGDWLIHAGTLAGYQGLAASGDQAPKILFSENLDQCAQLPAPQEAEGRLVEEPCELCRVI